MKRNIKKFLFPAVAVAVLSFAACSDWTETESLDINYPGRHLRNYLVARGAQPVDDLQQGSLRSRDRCDGEQLLPGHQLFHVAFDA